MKETRRFFDRLRAEEDNIWVFHKIGDVTVLVSNIDVEKQSVVVTLNPDIQQYQRTSPRPFRGGLLSGRSIEHQGTRPAVLNLNQPFEFPRDDKKFTIRVGEIGEVTERGDKQAYCDIEVEALGT